MNNDIASPEYWQQKAAEFEQFRQEVEENVVDALADFGIQESYITNNPISYVKLRNIYIRKLFQEHKYNKNIICKDLYELIGCAFCLSERHIMNVCYKQEYYSELTE